MRDQLPTSFVVTDSNGKETELTGTWKSAGYDKDAAGTYFVTFSCEAPETLLDSYELLRVRVVLSQSDRKGCRSSVSFPGAGIVFASFGAVAAIRKKKRKRTL